MQAEQRERIRAALDSLPVKARTIIMLSDVEGLSYKEIAEVLNCPIGTVMSRLHNARKRLRSLLGPMLAVVLIVMAALLAWDRAGTGGEPIVRFGVRVLQASNTPGPALATAPRALAPAGQHAGSRGRSADAAASSRISGAFSAIPTTPRSTGTAPRSRWARISGSCCPARASSRSCPSSSRAASRCG